MTEGNIGGRGIGTYDWGTIEGAFIHGDGKLVEHSRERTGLQNSPPYTALRKRAAKYSWTGKQAEIQAMRALVPPAPEERQQVADFQAQVEKLVDTATVVGDHLKLSKTMKSMYGALGVKVKKAIDDLDASSLTPGHIVRALGVMTSLINAATELERKSLGLAEPLQRVDVTTRYVISRDCQGKPDYADPPELSRDEWRDKYSEQN